MIDGLINLDFEGEDPGFDRNIITCYYLDLFSEKEKSCVGRNTSVQLRGVKRRN